MHDATLLSNDKLLLDRLSRIQGQLDGLKRAIERGTDCGRVIGQTKAAHAALKRFAEAYVDREIERCAANEGMPETMRRDMRELISSAFLL
jgi:DNA-binding FrmR family transcriptional regulator